MDAYPDSREGEALLVDGALRAAFLQLFPLIEQARIEQRGGYWLLASPLTPYPQFCGVWAGQTLEDDAACAAALEGSMEEIETRGMPFSLQVREGRADLTTQRGLELGLTEISEIEGMFLTVPELIAASDGDLTVRPVAAPEADVALGIAARGFEAPEAVFRPAYTPRVIAAAGVTYYLGLKAEEAVTTGVCVHTATAAGIFNIATPPEHRRQGYASQLVSHALNQAFAAGTRFGYLQASPMGAAVYHHLGFRTVEHYHILTRPPLS